MVKLIDASAGTPVWVNGRNVLLADPVHNVQDASVPLTRIIMNGGPAILIRGKANEIAHLLHHDQNAIVEQVGQFSDEGIKIARPDDKPRLVTS